jgi:nucleotide-binding universal stress UspA family protein
MYKNILVATDGSKLSNQAVKTAVGMAKQLGAKLVAAYVMPEYPSQVFAEGAAFTQYVTPNQFLQEQRSHAREVLEGVQSMAAKAGVSADTEAIQKRTPYEGIIAAAKRRKCDLIVMASHGRRGLAGMILGSETQKVLTHSKVPVLVVR